MTVTNLAQADWDRLGPSLADAIVDTLIMVSTTLIISGILGLGLGMLLYTTRAGGVLQNKFIFGLLNILVNFVRPIPFIILLVTLGPLTKISPLYGSKAIDLCADGDPYCSKGNNFFAHFAYPWNGMVTEAATFAAGKVLGTLS